MWFPGTDISGRKWSTGIQISDRKKKKNVSPLNICKAWHREKGSVSVTFWPRKIWIHASILQILQGCPNYQGIQGRVSRLKPENVFSFQITETIPAASFSPFVQKIGSTWYHIFISEPQSPPEMEHFPLPKVAASHLNLGDLQARFSTLLCLPACMPVHPS